MGRVADRVLDALAAEVTARTEWDEAPALCFLYLHEGKCHVRPISIPDSLWASDAPPRILEGIADCLGEFSWLFQPAAPGELHGAAFRCEMWEVRGDPADAAGFARAEADARARRLYTRPDRVETRSIWAVDRAGITYDVTIERVTGEVRRQARWPKPGVPAITGAVPDALDKLVTALLGVEMPARSRG